LVEYLEVAILEVVDLQGVDLEAVNLEVVHLELVDLVAVDLEDDYLEAVDLKATDREGGATGAESQFIGYLVIAGKYTIEYNNVCREMRDWQGVAYSSTRHDAIVGVCSTWCLLMIMAWSSSEERLNFVFLGDGRVEHKKER
jgi:hypothetical protein